MIFWSLLLKEVTKTILNKFWKINNQHIPHWGFCIKNDSEWKINYMWPNSSYFMKHLQMATSIYLPGFYQPGEKFTCTWFLIHLIYVRSKKKNVFLQIPNQIFYDFQLIYLCSPSCFKSDSNTYACTYSGPNKGTFFDLA